MGQSLDVRISSVGSGKEHRATLLTLGGIASTDPRFCWVADLLDEEPYRRLSVADMIEEHFQHPRADKARKAELLDRLTQKLRDMNTLNLAQELFAIGEAVEEDSHLLSVMARRLGWSGELWYTEQEASYALGISIPQVRSTRTRFVRHFRRGPVWAPVLRRCAAIAQHMGPLTATQFRAAFDIDQDGPRSMHLWGVLVALDLFNINHRFHMENTRTEPTLVSDGYVDFGYAREDLDYWAEIAELRISKALANERRKHREERRERERFIDPWEVTARRASKLTDVGVTEREHLHFSDISRLSPVWADTTFDPIRFGFKLRNLNWNDIPDVVPARISPESGEAALSSSLIDLTGVELTPITPINEHVSIQTCSEETIPPHPSLWSEVSIVTCERAPVIIAKAVNSVAEVDSSAVETEYVANTLPGAADMAVEALSPELVSTSKVEKHFVDAADLDVVDDGDNLLTEDAGLICTSEEPGDEYLPIDGGLEIQPELPTTESTHSTVDSIPVPKDCEPVSDSDDATVHDHLDIDEVGDSPLEIESSVEREDDASISVFEASEARVEGSEDPGDEDEHVDPEPSTTESDASPTIEDDPPLKPATSSDLPDAPEPSDEEMAVSPADVASIESQEEVTASASDTAEVDQEISRNEQESGERDQRSGFSRFWGAIANLFRRS